MIRLCLQMMWKNGWQLRVRLMSKVSKMASFVCQPGLKGFSWDSIQVNMSLLGCILGRRGTEMFTGSRASSIAFSDVTFGRFQNLNKVPTRLDPQTLLPPQRQWLPTTCWRPSLKTSVNSRQSSSNSAHSYSVFTRILCCCRKRKLSEVTGKTDV